MPRTDIVVTIGPASSSVDIMEKLIAAGAKIYRFPFAREPFDINIERSHQLRDISLRMGKEILLMQDVPGRKLRVAIPNDIPVQQRDYLEIGTNFGSFHTPLVHLPVDGLAVLPGDIQQGAVIYFGDGEIEAQVTDRASNGNIICQVINSGILQRYRGITFRDHFGNDEGLTDQDKLCIQKAISFHYDFIALSFVQSAEEIHTARSMISQDSQKIIAKIETPKGVNNISAILEATDAIMVARGDLAIQAPYELIPLMEWNLLKESTSKNKYSIVATQMIESVETRRVPNRSEIIDIATAVYWGASALMCSGETRTGSEPVYAVEVMKRIIEQAEKDISFNSTLAFSKC